MTRANKAMTILVVALLGLWGCARPPHQTAAQIERLKALETKCAKLEDDYRAVAAARDALRKRLAALEEEQVREREIARAVKQERDELRDMAESRTAERDALQTRFERMRKGIEALMSQDNALANPDAAPDTTTAEGPEVIAPGNS